MFDTKIKILEEFLAVMTDSDLLEVYKKNGISKDFFIKKLTKRSFEQLELSVFNKEYEKYGDLIEALIEKGSIWRNEQNNLFLPKKGEKIPDWHIKKLSMVNDSFNLEKYNKSILDIQKHDGNILNFENAKPVGIGYIKIPQKPPKTSYLYMLVFGIILIMFCIGLIIGFIIKNEIWQNYL